MVQYALNYFDVRGLGETARMVFYYANIDFQDNRITQEEWKNDKLKQGINYN